MWWVDVDLYAVVGVEIPGRQCCAQCRFPGCVLVDRSVKSDVWFDWRKPIRSHSGELEASESWGGPSCVPAIEALGGSARVIPLRLPALAHAILITVVGWSGPLTLPE